MDKTLVLKDILPMSVVGAESRVCQNRKYGEHPMRRTGMVKEPGNSRDHLRWCLTLREQNHTDALSKNGHERCVWMSCQIVIGGGGQCKQRRLQTCWQPS
jgi:hypothetical protein